MLNKELEILFKYIQGAGHLWDEHELGLVKKEHALQEMLQDCRVDHDNENLPLMSPIQYRSQLTFREDKYTASVSLNGAAKQSNFNSLYGEDQTNAFAILSASIGKQFYITNDDFFIKAGVENLFDANYSTYTDWKNLPRMGRNFYLTLSYTIQ